MLGFGRGRSLHHQSITWSVSPTIAATLLTAAITDMKELTVEARSR